MVNDLGDKNMTSLSTVIISAFIWTGVGKGFYNVINLWVVSLTRLDSSMGTIGSAGDTARLILKEMN